MRFLNLIYLRLAHFFYSILHEIRNKNLRDESKHGALDYVERFMEVFGSRFFIEMQMPCLPDFDDSVVFSALNAIAKKRKAS